MTHLSLTLGEEKLNTDFWSIEDNHLLYDISDTTAPYGYLVYIFSCFSGSDNKFVQSYPFTLSWTPL